MITEIKGCDLPLEAIMDWVKGKCLATIKKRLHNAWWDMVWIPEENMLDVWKAHAGIAYESWEIRFSEKGRAISVRQTIKNGDKL